MLSGQIADGLTTPLVGFYSDKTTTKIGKRTPWYIFGAILVLPTFLAIFIYPEFGENKSLQIAYYILLPALFNIGIQKI
jgi:Na+/melibiose symporter-like transporter